VAQNRHFAPPTAESPIAQRRLRWPNPQSRSAGCDGLTIWSDQSKAPIQKHHTQIIAEISGLAHQKVATLAPHQSGSTRNGTIPSIRTTAPHPRWGLQPHGFLSSQPKPATQHLRSDHLPIDPTPSPRSTTGITAEIAGRESRKGEEEELTAPELEKQAICRRPPSPSPPNEATPRLPSCSAVHAGRRGRREREREPREEGLVGLQCAARKNGETEGERKGKVAGGS